jgi:Tfp pilus assembly protein PilF
MFAYFFTLWLIAALEFSKVHAYQQDIGEVLARSEALYYEAKFRESVDLLAALDSSLQTEPGNLQERARLKLQLALGYFALNDLAKAKINFVEMCTLDPYCSLEADKYPPKVLALFEEAKVERVKDAAQRAFQQGLEAHKKDDSANAVQKFNDAIRLNPEHGAAIQYLTLTQEKLRVGVEQRLLDWHKHFSAGEMGLAAADYRQLQSLNLDRIGDNAINEIQTEYRQALDTSIAAWNRACKTGDASGMNRLRTQAGEMLAGTPFGEDLLSQTLTCNAKPCVQMNVQTAMLRVKTSAKPEIPPVIEKSLATPQARTVRVEVRIDETGDVIVTATHGVNAAVNDAVRNAVEKWKFVPAVFESEPRCVDTAFPIVITPSGPN